MTKKKEPKVTVSNHTVTLTTKDRLFIGRLMPERGAFLDMLVGRHIEKKCEFSPEEIEELKFQNSGEGRVTWDVEKETPKAIEFTGTEISFLHSRIDDLSSKNDLPYAMVDLCEKLKGV